MTDQATKAKWCAADAATPGRDHLRRGIPCQDAACAFSDPRAGLLVCDGRGSAPLSQLGTQAAIRAYREWLYLSEVFLRSNLDDSQMEPPDASRLWHSVASSLYAALAQVQVRLVEQRGGRPRDYEFTAVAFIVGRTYAGWMTVGDSLLVVEQAGQLKALGREGAGEFANQTRFVRPVASGEEPLQCGILPVSELGLAAAFSDGTASRFFDLKRGLPAGAVAQLGNMLSSGTLSSEDLHEMLTDRDWDQATGDDRSLALLAPVDCAPGQGESAAQAEPLAATTEPLYLEGAEGEVLEGEGALSITLRAPQVSGRLYLWLLLAAGVGLDIGLLIGQIIFRLQTDAL